MYYPHLERQDQFVRVLARLKKIEDTLEEVKAEMKAINEKLDALIQSPSNQR